MAYDEALAERVRAALGAIADVAEIKMFGGLCFTVRGTMAVGVTGDELMVRIDPAAVEAAVAEPGARQMDMRGRPMKGFLAVAAANVKASRSLQRWVDRGVTYASSLPPKKAKRAKA
jgi:TfoX/Sxy family transcriptional regulator of competence genes